MRFCLEPLDDLTILVLFSAFESAVRDRVLSTIDREIVDHLLSEPAPAGDLRDTFGFVRVASGSWLLQGAIGPVLRNRPIVPRLFQPAPAGDQPNRTGSPGT